MPTATWLRICLTGVSLLATSGCSTWGVPREISEAITTDASVAQVKEQPERYLGARLRWGGTILAVHNLPRVTRIEILSRPLASNGEPDGDGEGLGRFMAETPGFLDPTSFPKDRLLTVVGTLSGMETRMVGEYPYHYPVITMDARHLWPVPEPEPLRYDPYPYPYFYPYPWYRPWGYPWYW